MRGESQGSEGHGSTFKRHIDWKKARVFTSSSGVFPPRCWKRKHAAHVLDSIQPSKQLLLTVQRSEIWKCWCLANRHKYTHHICSPADHTQLKCCRLNSQPVSRPELIAAVSLLTVSPRDSIQAWLQSPVRAYTTSG